MVKTPANPGGLPKEVFDGLQAQLAANRSQFYRDLPAGPFYGYNRPGAKPSEAVIQNWWRQGMMGGAKAHYDGIVAFSQTDFTEDLKKITVPVLVMHGDDDQIVPYADSAPLSAKLLKNGTLKTYKGFPHGMPTTEAATINADLLAFIKMKGMKVILFGATGMVGQGVLRECLLDAGVERVLAVGRSPTGLRIPSCARSSTTISRITPRSSRSSPATTPVSSASASPRSAWTRSATAISPMTSRSPRRRRWRGSIPAWCSPTSPAAAPTSTEHGSLMWARVKGKTENDLLKLPFKAAYMFRPAGIQPLHGVRSKTAWVQAIYVVAAPLLSFLVPRRAELHDHVASSSAAP